MSPKIRTDENAGLSLGPGRWRQKSFRNGIVKNKVLTVVHSLVYHVSLHAESHIIVSKASLRKSPRKCAAALYTRVSAILFISWCRPINIFFFFSSRRRHTRLVSDWSSDVCSSD